MKTFTSILLPTDFSRASHSAFQQALRIALDGKCSLRLVHVGEEDTPPWAEFPGVRLTLERWGLLPPGSKKEEVAQLGVRIMKFFVSTSDPVGAILTDVKRKEPNLLVMATHARQGLSRLLHSSICKQVVRRSKLPTLIVPHQAQSLVNDEDGRCGLKKVLLPISPEVKPNYAVELTARLLNTLNGERVRVRCVYVGKEGERPHLNTVDSDRIGWEFVTRQGQVVDALSKELKEFEPDLVVMLGRGRDSVLDYLMPGKLERLAGEAECPLLVQNVASP